MVDLNPSDRLLCEGDQVNLGGRARPWCREILTPDQLELKFLTQTFHIKVESLRRLRSGGSGSNRHLEVVHEDQKAPDSIKVYPHYPERWFQAFETLGIPTEDEVDLRHAKQWPLRTSSWASNAEGCFWSTVFGAGALAGLISAICKFLD